MSEPYRCEHLPVESINRQYWFRITAKKAGTVKELCWDCCSAFLQSIKFDPTITVGYHVYRTSDPNLPKEQWERLTQKPVPIEQFKDSTREQGVEYYYFNTPVSAYGEEGEPEAAWDARGTSLGEFDDHTM
jgi:hypothetical protein